MIILYVLNNQIHTDADVFIVLSIVFQSNYSYSNFATTTTSKIGGLYFKHCDMEQTLSEIMKKEFVLILVVIFI